MDFDTHFHSIITDFVFYCIHFASHASPVVPERLEAIVGLALTTMHVRYDLLDLVLFEVDCEALYMS